MTFALRKAGLDDLDTLVNFNIAHAREVEDKALSAAVLDGGIRHLLAHSEEGFYILAENTTANQATVTAGILMVTTEWSDWRNGRFWWIQSVYVAPDFRRQGVYGRMHDWVREQAQQETQCCGLRLYVEKENTAAQAAYVGKDMRETYYRLYEEVFNRPE